MPNVEEVEEEEEEEPEIVESDVEIDDEGVVEPDSDEPQPVRWMDGWMDGWTRGCMHW